MNYDYRMHAPHNVQHYDVINLRFCAGMYGYHITSLQSTEHVSPLRNLILSSQAAQSSLPGKNSTLCRCLRNRTAACYCLKRRTRRKTCLSWWFALPPKSNRCSPLSTGTWIEGSRLAACLCAHSDCNNSAPECPKDHRGGIVKIVIFFCV